VGDEEGVLEVEDGRVDERDVVRAEEGEIDKLNQVVIL
jgi:hypothetical protein